LREVEVVEARHVERREDVLVAVPDAGELLWPELDRRGHQALPECALVAELDQLPHDRVEPGNRLQRGRGGPVRRMLVGLRRDAGEPARGGAGHPPFPVPTAPRVEALSRAARTAASLDFGVPSAYRVPLCRPSSRVSSTTWNRNSMRTFGCRSAARIASV